jgi:hypothetical protein
LRRQLIVVLIATRSRGLVPADSCLEHRPASTQLNGALLPQGLLVTVTCQAFGQNPTDSAGFVSVVGSVAGRVVDTERLSGHSTNGGTPSMSQRASVPPAVDGSNGTGGFGSTKGRETPKPPPIVNGSGDPRTARFQSGSRTHRPVPRGCHLRGTEAWGTASRYRCWLRTCRRRSRSVIKALHVIDAGPLQAATLGRHV